MVGGAQPREGGEPLVKGGFQVALWDRCLIKVGDAHLVNEI